MDVILTTVDKDYEFKIIMNRKNSKNLLPMNAIVRDFSNSEYLRNLNRLAADEHLGLHMAILGMINEYGVDTLHLGPHIDVYIDNIKMEQAEKRKSAPGRIAKYMTARYSTDRQCKRMIHVVCMFNAYMPSKALETFVFELDNFLSERLKKHHWRNTQCFPNHEINDVAAIDFDI